MIQREIKSWGEPFRVSGVEYYFRLRPGNEGGKRRSWTRTVDADLIRYQDQAVLGNYYEHAEEGEVQIVAFDSDANCLFSGYCDDPDWYDDDWCEEGDQVNIAHMVALYGEIKDQAVSAILAQAEI